MELIVAKNLGKTYRTEDVETPALKGASFVITQGEFVAIMGPSGSGKSTLLHILGFLDEPTEGEYFLNGKGMHEFTSDELARIRNQKMGFVFQAFNLLPRTTVQDNVRLPLLYSAVLESQWSEHVNKAVHAVGLSHRIDHTPGQLSGGEKQRAAIARALVMKPDIIFADEPTGNLDSVSGGMIMDILQKLNKEDGHTIVLITHETVTAEYAERVIRLRDGMIESDTKVKRRRVGENGYMK